MRITVHSAENQQRFAIALTLTQKWLTTKTAADVVRLFVQRFDAARAACSTVPSRSESQQDSWRRSSARSASSSF